MVATVGNPPGWDEEQKELRRTEVRTAWEGLRAQRRIVRIQAAALTLALVASVAAAYAAYEAGQAVKASAENNAQQAAESQLTTAVSAIGGATPAQRVAGLTLLRRNIATQVNAAEETSDTLTRQNAYDGYVTSLSVLATYIRASSAAESPAVTTVSSSFGLGYGIPKAQQPIDLAYAVDELRLLLGMTGEVRAIKPGRRPAIDLSYDELYGLSLKGIDFSWLSSAYMLQVDMRMSNLASSRWSGSSFLVHAYLQCADLSGADFRGANLTGADLRGANVSGANFAGAILTGVKTDGVFGRAKGLLVPHPATSWNQEGCAIHKKNYWDLPKHR
jgi:hypothetical protein